MKIFGKSTTEFLIEKYRYVLIAVGLVLALVGYLIFIGPELAEVRQFGAVDLHEEKTKLEDRRQYLGRLQVMLDAYQVIDQESLDNLRSILPTQEDIPELFIIVEDLAFESGLSLASVSVSPANLETETSAQGAGTSTPLSQLAKSKKLKALDISVTAINGSSYEDFKTFLVNIENANRLFDLRSMQFTPEPKEATGSSETTTSASPYSVNFRTYYIDKEES